ncbi:MAG: hypothetical protein QM811_01575 [Pirellulales bacterium]
MAEFKAQLALERNERETTRLASEQALRQSVLDLERERSELELELENVRQRAVELGDELTELKRTCGEERESWQSEIRQLRKTIEKSAQAGPRVVEQPGEVVHETASPATHMPEPAKPVAPTAGTFDPVLGSVLTQFQALQKDLARRRQPKAKS